MENREFSLTLRLRLPRIQFGKIARRLLPSPGSVIFTLVMIALLVLAQTVGALPLGRPQAAPAAASTGTIAYQGRLADANGVPINKKVGMTFRLYEAAEEGTPLWTEPWIGTNEVNVSDGLFNVMLGSLTPLQQSDIAGHSQLYLGISVGNDDEMRPRVQLGSVPFAVQALTVPDGSVTTGKIADGAVTTAGIANGAVTQDKAPNLVKSSTPATKMAYGMATVARNDGDRIGYVGISLAGNGFSQPPTVLCSTAGASGFAWNCHVEYETASSFGIWVYRIDGSTNWTAVPVRWVAIGN